MYKRSSGKRSGGEKEKNETKNRPISLAQSMNPLKEKEIEMQYPLLKQCSPFSPSHVVSACL